LAATHRSLASCGQWHRRSVAEVDGHLRLELDLPGAIVELGPSSGLSPLASVRVLVHAGACACDLAFAYARLGTPLHVLAPSFLKHLVHAQLNDSWLSVRGHACARLRSVKNMYCGCTGMFGVAASPVGLVAMDPVLGV
jgi:hypothetical protein